MLEGDVRDAGGQRIDPLGRVRVHEVERVCGPAPHRQASGDVPKVVLGKIVSPVGEVLFEVVPQALGQLSDVGRILRLKASM